MKYIIADLEWNGSFSKKAHGYFNEIIEVGAVAFDEDMQPLGTFHRVIRPVVSKKLSQIVRDLTHITPEELESSHHTFESVMRELADWAGDEAALLTWSNTDLLVLIENFEFFTKKNHIPFMKYYADAQVYCQKRMGVDTSQQMGLSRACEALGIGAQDSALHRALDDSRLTAKVFSRLYDKESFLAFVQPVNDEFYARLLFKPIVITSTDHPLVKRSDLCFSCEECGKNLHRKTKWSFRNRHFYAVFFCRHCKKTYTANVQYKQTYDGIVVRRRLKEKPPAEETPSDE